MKQKKNLYFKYGVSLLAALVISLFFSYTIFNDIFASPVKEARLVITATAERNIKSGGSDIRIVRILLDGEEVPFDSIEKQGTGIMQMVSGWWSIRTARLRFLIQQKM